MKLKRIFLKPGQTVELLLSAMTKEEKDELRAKLLAKDEPKKNDPVGYGYCEEEKGLSTSVFISTRKDDNSIFRTKSGDICLNIKDPQKKGDHKADEPEVTAEAQAEAEETEEQQLAGAL